jgi:hypothetical protein
MSKNEQNIMFFTIKLSSDVISCYYFLKYF